VYNFPFSNNKKYSHFLRRAGLPACLFHPYGRHNRELLSYVFNFQQMGIAAVDSSVAGLGGCPYAKGATGNVATEDVLFMLHGLGIKTNVDIDKVMEAGDYICKQLGRSSGSRTAVALAKVNGKI
jgi:hydroxymethylglutaryl-CoA lyase